MKDIVIILNGKLQQVSSDELLKILNSEHDDLAVIFGAEHLRDEQKELLELKK